MKILLLSQLLPLPLDAGPKLRSYYVLRQLAESGHAVSLVCFVRPTDRQENLEQIRRLCASVDTVPLIRSRRRDVFDGVRSLLTGASFLVLRDQLKPMREKITHLVQRGEFDAVHCDQLWMAPYGLDHPGLGRKVLDQHNAVFLVMQRLATYDKNPVRRAWLRSEAARLLRFERRTCGRFDRVVWVSDQDRKAVGGGQIEPRPQDAVIPIATDPASRKVIKQRRPFRVTFLGGMHWPPNAEGISWFAKEVWPTVRRAVPDAVLTVIGRRPPRKLRALQAGDQIEAVGYVRDLEQFLEQTVVFVIPLRCGAGMRVKILDAWTWGLPVVSTSVGAEGIAFRHQDDILIADEADAFAEAVIRVAQDSKLSRRLADGGRSTVERLYDWKNVYQAWDQVYS